MTTISDVRTEIARILDTIDGWSTGYDESNLPLGYVGEAVPEAYSFRVVRPAFDPRMVFSQAKATHTFRVIAYAPRATAAEAERRLDELCELSGDRSLIATIQDGNNWLIDVDSAQVTQCGETAVADWDGASFLACDFQIEVMW